ncbi:MAG TPA: ribonuclease J [Candidatus Onthovivens sp.]|nr:ribonuclease J [Candidatus Onthovivens sp.]
MDKIKILALGGLDEQGKDLYCIEINDNIFVIGAGFKYPTKSTPGIDFIIGDFSYLKDNKDRIKAYILPKAKKNSFGAIPYIYKVAPAPIYCGSVTAKFLEEFSKLYQQENKYDFHLFNLPSIELIGGYQFDFFSTCSSMPSTCGFSIRTQLGNIVYSGDFIVEYSNDKFFKLDLNALAKIAERNTLILLAESVNSQMSGYCAPRHKLTPYIEQAFKEAEGRVFIALNSNNLYHISEVFNACKVHKKKVFLYDKESQAVYDMNAYGNIDSSGFKDIVDIDNVLRVKESELVIVMIDENERIYEKVSILANNENENRQIRLTARDTFLFAAPASDSNEVIAISALDEVYRTNCKVKNVSRKLLPKMHAFEEDLKMLLSLLKPKYYLPIEGYYVDLLANAKLAFDMDIGLSHFNIFLLDNGQTINIDENGAEINFNTNNKIMVGDMMIDGIGVGDVVTEIISDRTRLGKDGVVVLGCAVSKSKREIVAGPDIQMRGFLFLKDKDSDVMLKELTKMFVERINKWSFETKDFNTKVLELQINQEITKFLLKSNNRNPLVKPNVIIVN